MTPSPEVMRQNRNAAVAHVFNAGACLVILALVLAAIWIVAGTLTSELTGH